LEKERIGAEKLRQDLRVKEELLLNTVLKRAAEEKVLQSLQAKKARYDLIIKSMDDCHRQMAEDDLR